MGSNRYKISYKCTCGVNWGDCDETNVWLLSYSRSVDVTTIVHIYHAGTAQQSVQQLRGLEDVGVDALIKLIHMADPSEGERWTKDDMDLFDKLPWT